MIALVTSPLVVPLLVAILAALAYRRPRLQRAIGLVGAVAFLGCAVALVAAAGRDALPSVAFGGWAAPFGIEFRIDRLGALMILLAAIMTLATEAFLASDAETRPRPPFLVPILHGMLAGVGGAFATADLFNLYVWFEVMLIGAIGLFAIGGRLDQLDATLKYLALNVVGTLLLVTAVATVYATTGHLNFAAIAASARSLEPATATALAAALGFAFLAKAGAFPVFAWLPAAYHTLPGPVLALVAGLLTKVGIYALLRTAGELFVPTPAALLDILGWIAAATMLTGVLGAAYHWDMRRILGFHVISQIGYMLLGIAVGTEAGTAFYVAHHIIVKANLFLIAALAWRLSGDYDLRRIGGLARARPALAFVFAVPALSLVGIPPLSGFWAKFLVLGAAIEADRVAWTAVALVVSALTLYSMMKIWMEAFWKPHPDPAWRFEANSLGPAWCVTGGLAAITLAIGLFPQPLVAYCLEAAASLGGKP